MVSDLHSRALRSQVKNEFARLLSCIYLQLLPFGASERYVARWLVEQSVAPSWGKRMNLFRKLLLVIGCLLSSTA
jgi:hypothetical protein